MKEKITSINGLRGIACFMILLYHFRFYLLNLGFNFIDYGYYFVEVFMTISGFLIAYNYGERQSELKFSEFFIKRYLKIMPLFWLTEILMLVITIAADFMSGKDIKLNFIEEIIRYSGMGVRLFGSGIYPRNNPLWTITSLLICYFLYYIYGKIVSGKKRLIILYVLTIVVSVSLILLNFNNLLRVNENVSLCIISFFVGILIFEIYDRYQNYRKMGSVLISCFTVIGFIFLINNQGNFQVLNNSLFVCFVFCPCLVYCSVSVNVIKKILNLSLLQFLGEISMDLYMWHWVVRVYLGSRPIYIQQETLSGFLILIISSILMAILSHYVIIKRLNRIINVIKYNKNLRYRNE